MKISVLTTTYNRGNLLGQVYSSLLENNNYGVEIEWLIMDDESTDNTKYVVESFGLEKKITIKYFWQKNQEKMASINNLIKKTSGDLIVICDSDDYFTKDAFKIIKEEYEKNKEEEVIYGLCFLKYNQNMENMGKTFIKNKTTMFDLYFKEGEDGEKAIVFYSEIRKKYKHELENKEKIITEARMYHKIDKEYKMICINKPIMICEYLSDGKTKNIQKQFKENPYGYYEYFKEIFSMDMKNIKFSKRLYIIKHYILFKYLTNSKKSLKNVKGILNKILYIFLYIPGIHQSKRKFSK